MDWLTAAFPTLLIALICPIVMLVLMRGMHGGHRAPGEHAAHAGRVADADELARLRAEVAALREQVDTQAEARR
jgi:hypothetical protein